jgi:hypothetical protein
VHGLEFALPLSPLVAIDKPVSHGIHSGMVQIQQTETYAKWFAGLPDRVARARIDIRNAKALAKDLKD